MLRSALRDLQWRSRRFGMAVLGTALVFGMALTITGVSEGFGAEASGTVLGLGASAWIVKAGASGPFLGAAPMAESQIIEAIVGMQGATKAAAVVFARKDVIRDGRPTSVNVIGAPVGTLGSPAPVAGHRPLRSGQISISTRLAGYPLGSTLSVAGYSFRVVGKVADATALGGVPNVYLPLADAQAVAFAGLPVANAIAVSGGVPSSVPAGFTLMSNQQAEGDLLRALAQAKSSITLLATLLWIVAAMIVGSVIYVTVLERQRDFAVFKAVGVASASILGGLAVQAVVLSLAAGVIGVGISEALGPRFPVPVDLTPGGFALLPAIAIVVGLIASMAGLRRAVSVDPAMAFGGP